MRRPVQEILAFTYLSVESRHLELGIESNEDFIA